MAYWYATHSTSSSSDNTTTSVTVTAYWQNSGSNTHNVNHVSAWVYCGDQSYQIMNNGSVNAMSSAAINLGSHTFTFNRGTSASSVSCYARIKSSSSYHPGESSSGATSVSIPAKASYTVSYNANGGTGAPGNQTKWYGTTLTLSSTRPTRTGYTFLRWNTNSSGTGTNYNPGDSYTGNAALTLYAIWQANSYTITFDKQGGSGGTDSVSITYDTPSGSYPDITLPTRKGYTFTGYYTETGGSGTQYYNSAGNSVRTWQIAADTTLYAGWSTNPPSEMNITYVGGRVDGFTTQLSAFSAEAITNYTLYYRKKGSSDWITKDLGTNATAFVGLGLETDTDYELKFSATNAGGTTTSDIFTFSTLMATPSLTSFEISNLLPFSFTVTVEGTSNPERVISYAFSKDGGATWSSYQASGTYNFTGLNEETSYDVGVSVKAKALGVNASDTEYIETKVVVTPADQAKIRIKKDGIWKKGKAYYKKDGKWVKAKKIYIKVDGQWKINNNYDS